MKYQSLLWAVVGVGVLSALAAWYYPRVDQYSDIFFYEKIATDVASVRGGAAPGEPSAWYPPFAAAVFYGVSFIPHFSYIQSWLLFVVVCTALATVYLHYVVKFKRAYLLPLAISACFFLLGNNVTFARYDILIGLCIVLGYASFRSKQFALAAIWILCAGGLKAVPFLLLPPLLLMIPRERMRSAALGLIVGFLLILGLPALLIGPKQSFNVTKAFVSFQGERGFQIESTWSGADILLRNMQDQKAYAAFHHFATHNMDFGVGTFRIATVIAIFGLLYIYWRIWKHPNKGSLDFALIVAACICWTLFVASVFSPQFLLWVVPLLFVWLAMNEVQGRRYSFLRIIAAVVVFVCVASHYIYPFHYRELIDQTYIFTIVVLNVRNLAVGVLAFLCLREAGIVLPVPFRLKWKQLVVFFTKETAPLTLFQKKSIAWLMVALTACFIAYICSFTLFDRDFWWHIKAGEIMWQTKNLITVEPFAYTREGLPYVASQSYLAEIVMYGIHAITGINGIIIFRTLSMIVVFGVLLALNKKHIWLTCLLAIFASNVSQGAFMDRPQLFTFMIFALFLYISFQVLERGLSVRSVVVFIILEILWVNMHGAAAFLGIFIVMCLLLQRAYSQKQHFLWQPWALILGGVIIAFFLSPGGYHNVMYIFQLLSDNTIVFIEEWQPISLSLYLGKFGVFWVFACWAIWNTRRNWVYSTFLVLGTGFLSLRALRHEVLFVIASTGVILYQLSYNEKFNKLAIYLARRHVLAGGVLLVSLFGLFQYTKNNYQNFVQQDQLYGYGAFTPAKGAFEFIEKNNLQGNMFNTYGIGGYLLNRGYPNRKVYIDGRNVDYGYEFMNETFQGGLDGESWKKLEDKYNLSYAVIDYMAIANVGRAGYSIHLDKNPTWRLVYLDDWTGVYVNDIPENKDVIHKFAYRYINPINIDKGGILDEVTSGNTNSIAEELQRVIAGNSDGVQARILLARLFVFEHKFTEARKLLYEARATAPHLADVYQILADIAVQEQQYIEAAEFYGKMLKYTGKAYPNINYRAIADVFEKAGHPIKAAYYRYLAQPVLEKLKEVVAQASPLRHEATGGAVGEAKQNNLGDLFASIAQDITKYNDEGSNLGGQGKFSEAEAKFLEALKLDPSNPQTLNNLGVLSLQKKDDAAALDYFTRALERSAEYPDAHYNLAILYYRQGKYDEAILETKLAEKYGRDVKSLFSAIREKEAAVAR